MKSKTFFLLILIIVFGSIQSAYALEENSGARAIEDLIPECESAGGIWESVSEDEFICWFPDGGYIACMGSPLSCQYIESAFFVVDPETIILASPITLALAGVDAGTGPVAQTDEGDGEDTEDEEIDDGEENDTEGIDEEFCAITGGEFIEHGGEGIYEGHYSCDYEDGSGFYCVPQADMCIHVTPELPIFDNDLEEAPVAGAVFVDDFETTCTFTGGSYIAFEEGGFGCDYPGGEDVVCDPQGNCNPGTIAEQWIRDLSLSFQGSDELLDAPTTWIQTLVGPDSLFGINGLLGPNSIVGMNGIVGQNGLMTADDGSIVGMNGFIITDDNTVIGPIVVHVTDNLVGDSSIVAPNNVVGPNTIIAPNNIVSVNGIPELEPICFPNLPCFPGPITVGVSPIVNAECLIALICFPSSVTLLLWVGTLSLAPIGAVGYLTVAGMRSGVRNLRALTIGKPLNLLIAIGVGLGLAAISWFGIQGLSNSGVIGLSYITSPPSPTNLVPVPYPNTLMANPEESVSIIEIREDDEHQDVSFGSDVTFLDRCEIFEILDMSMVVLPFLPDSTILPLYLGVEGGIPGLVVDIEENDPFEWTYSVDARGRIADCNLIDDFDDRLYCHMEVSSGWAGTEVGFDFFLNGCETPIYFDAAVLPGIVVTTDDSAGGGSGSGGGGGDPLTGSVSGTVFKDGNGDGIMNGTDPGFAGINVYMMVGACGSGGAVDSVSSSNGGNFSFTGLAAGTYCVAVDVQPVCGNYSVGTTSDGFTVNIEAGGSANVNFGFQKLIC